MSDQVNIGHGPTFTLAPGAETTAWLDWAYFNRNRWQRISVSPDNFPSSIEIVREWFVIDVGNATRLFGYYRNNGSDTVVFRLAVTFAPAAF